MKIFGYGELKYQRGFLEIRMRPKDCFQRTLSFLIALKELPTRDSSQEFENELKKARIFYSMKKILLYGISI